MQDTKNSRRRTNRRSSGEHKERKTRSSSADDVRVLEEDRAAPEAKSSDWTSDALDHQTSRKSRGSRNLSSGSSKRQSRRSLERSLSRRDTNDSKKRSSRLTRSSSAYNVRRVEDKDNVPADTWSLSLDQADEKRRRNSRKPDSKRRDNESLGSSSHHKRKTKKMTRSLSFDDTPLDDTPLSTLDEATDAWPLVLSLDDNKTADESVKKKESAKNSRSSRRGGGRRKHRANSMPVNSSPIDASTKSSNKSKKNKSPGASKSSGGGVLSQGVATDADTDGTQLLMGETVNEENEANRERIRDLEVQNNQIQEQHDAMVKRKKDKNDGQDPASRAGRKITLSRVISVAVIYLAGVGTGFLISELRHKRASAPAKEIYVTQSPSAVVVPSNHPTTAPTEFSYDDPAPEDCFAIEAKEEVNGQDGMITRSYDVHFDVQLKDSSADWYGQLQEGVTDKVVPDLACCKGAPTGERRLLVGDLAPRMDFSIRGGHIMNRMLRNIRCVVANGSTRGESSENFTLGENGDSCVELTGLCIPAVVTLDLTLKGDEADGDIMDLVRSVIQGDDSDEPLVEKFDLERNVFSLVKLVDVVDHVPTRQPAVSSPPTSRPTLSPTVTLSSAPVVRPTATKTPTRVVTQSPTSGRTPPPTTRPAPGVTKMPTSEPSAQPTTSSTPAPNNAEPSPGPTESPSSSPTLVPTILASASPSASPTTPAPSLTPSAAPTGRREAFEAILTPVVGTIDTTALDWLADTDTWDPPATEADPDSAWLERYSMVRFYLATNGASWTDKGGWMTSSTSVCDWSPGTCNGNNRVILIDEGGNGLSGTLPTEIGLLPHLDSLKINKNFELSGSLPSEIGLLTKLTHFTIWKCGLTGLIPSELSLLTMLEDITLGANDLSGSIPTTLGQLTKLTFISLNENKRLNGPIPTEIGLLTALTRLDMGKMGLGGPIPSEINLLTKLRILTSSGTDRSGSSIPDLSALVNLERLEFGDCGLTGSIPPDMFNNMVSSLESFGFWGNDLSGSIPTTLGQLTKLTLMSFAKNERLNGPIPTEIGLLTALTRLDMGTMGLGGSIPSEINLLTKLRILTSSGTDRSGSSIPDLSALVNLEWLQFADCGLTGSIPPGMLNNMASLEKIDFSQNSLTGAIPAVPNPSLLVACLFNDNCFSDLTNAGTCDNTNNCG